MDNLNEIYHSDFKNILQSLRFIITLEMLPDVTNDKERQSYCVGDIICVLGKKFIIDGIEKIEPDKFYIYIGSQWIEYIDPNQE